MQGQMGDPGDRQVAGWSQLLHPAAPGLALCPESDLWNEAEFDLHVLRDSLCGERPGRNKKVDNWERKLKIDNSGQARLVEISLVQYQYLLGRKLCIENKSMAFEVRWT